MQGEATEHEMMNQSVGEELAQAKQENKRLEEQLREKQMEAISAQEKNAQEKSDADKKYNERVQQLRHEHIQFQQVWLWRAVSSAWLTM